MMKNDKKIKLGKFTGDADPGQSIQTFTGSLNNLLSPGFYSNDNSVILVMTTSANILMQVRWSNTGVQEIRVRNSNNVWGDWNKSITEADGITKGAPTVPEGVNKPGVFYFNTGTISAVPNMPIIKNADDSIINFFQANIPVKGLLEIIEGDDGFYVERIFMTFTLNSTTYAKVFYRIVENINESNIPWYEVKNRRICRKFGIIMPYTDENSYKQIGFISGQSVKEYAANMALSTDGNYRVMDLPGVDKDNHDNFLVFVDGVLFNEKTELKFGIDEILIDVRYIGDNSVVVVFNRRSHESFLFVPKRDKQKCEWAGYFIWRQE